ncbi:MAG: DUF2252 family protein [bacterium]
MTIVEATDRYHAWLAEHTPLDEQALGKKRKKIRKGPFPFLRGTFYRWAQTWAQRMPAESATPRVLAIGDLHLENFGTWRDAEGRLVWGVNDFDEAYPLPWTNDVIRLATSILLAADERHPLKLTPADACDALLDGYRRGLKTGGRAYVLAEGNKWLRSIAADQLWRPSDFWDELTELERARTPDARAVEAILLARMPEPLTHVRTARREAGVGSLGRPRFVTLARWNGAWIAREAKARVPSAAVWARGRPDGRDHWGTILRRAVRASDPFLASVDGWVVRRLAPDSVKIELADLPTGRDQTELVAALGFETANIHLGSGSATRAVLRDLQRRRGPWLHRAAREMAEHVRNDWSDWKKATK